MAYPFLSFGVNATWEKGTRFKGQFSQVSTVRKIDQQVTGASSNGAADRDGLVSDRLSSYPQDVWNRPWSLVSVIVSEGGFVASEELEFHSANFQE